MRLWGYIGSVGFFPQSLNYIFILQLQLHERGLKLHQTIYNQVTLNDLSAREGEVRNWEGGTLVASV